MKHLAIFGAFLALVPVTGMTTQPTFELPTFQNKKPDFKAAQSPILPDPRIDSQRVFEVVISCYPTPSRFGEQAITREENHVFQNPSGYTEQFGISDYGNHYFSIVGNMPLIDESDIIDRQRTREYNRRKDTAAQVATFTKAIAKRNHAEREIGLYSALERRSQVRVEKGITGVAEQIGHLESVISAQKKYTEAKAEVLQARLALSGQCQIEYQNAIDDYLKNISEWKGG